MAESALAPTTAPAQDALPGEHNEAGAQEPEPPSDAPEEKPTEPEAFLTRAQQDSKFPTSRKGRKGGKQKASAKPKGKAKSSARPKAKAGTKPKAKASPKPKATPKPKAQAGAKPKGKPGPKCKGAAKAKAQKSIAQPLQADQEPATFEPDSTIQTPPPKRNRTSEASRPTPEAPAPNAKTRGGPRPKRECQVDQSWLHCSIVPYWSKNHVGLKMKGSGSQALDAG